MTRGVQRGPCPIDNCGRPGSNRGLCAMHYRRGSRLSQRIAAGVATTLPERFWAKVARGGDDECWEWTASRRAGKHDYGMFQTGDRCVNAMRIAWELANGQPVPRGVCVMHSCDNPPCCNPAHLTLGTLSDNLRDMWAKGRANPLGPRGERAPAARLTEAQVLEIRARLAGGEGIRPLAREIGVSRGAIADIDKRRTWDWLPDADTAGRNSGKPQRVRRWVGEAA